MNRSTRQVSPGARRARNTLGAAVGVLVLVAMLGAATALPDPAQAADLHRYPDADIALGEKLVREHQCDACHIRRVGGDGSAIYRPKGRINSPGALRGMVDYCSVELKLSLFPEEVTAIAAVLQRDHYRFPATPAR